MKAVADLLIYLKKAINPRGSARPILTISADDRGVVINAAWYERHSITQNSGHFSFTEINCIRNSKSLIKRFVDDCNNEEISE
jgi:hypothetical protein